MIRVRRLLWCLLLPAALIGCSGGLIDDPAPFCPAPDPQRVCYLDSDCAPSGCCGESSCAVHVADAPDCRGARCDGSCDPLTTDCGCGLPVCRDGACTVARSVGGGC